MEKEKIVVGFEKVEDVEKILEVFGKKGWCWSNGVDVEEYKEYTNFFEEYTTKGGFYLEFNNNFGFGSMDGSIGDKEVDNIHFSTLLEEKEKEEEEFKIGEEIMVWDIKGKAKEKRTFLGMFNQVYMCKSIGNIEMPTAWKFAEKIKKQPKFKVGDYFVNNNGTLFKKCYEIGKKSDGTYTYNGHNECNIRVPTEEELKLYFI